MIILIFISLMSETKKNTLEFIKGDMSKVQC